jgi:hypothetical protein
MVNRNFPLLPLFLVHILPLITPVKRLNLRRTQDVEGSTIAPVANGSGIGSYDEQSDTFRRGLAIILGNNKLSAG